MTDKQNKGWLGRLLDASIANRIAFAAACVTILIALLIGSVSHIFIRSYIMERSAAAIEKNAGRAGQRLEYFLNSIAHDVSSMSENLILSNALVDSQGREIYLLPFLKGYKMSEGVSFTLTLSDFQGMPIASNLKDKPPPYKNPEMLRQVIDKGTPYIEITKEPKDPRLLVAYPVFYGATHKPEGIIVMETCLKDIFDSAASLVSGDAARSLSIASGDSVIWTNGVEKKKDYAASSKTLNLKEPLKSLNLRIELAAPSETPLRNLYLSLLAIGILTLGLTIILSKAIAARLTKRLVELSETAHNIAESGLPDRIIKVEGSDEIGKLASALKIMLEKLKASHVDLELLVMKRTAELKERENFLQTIIETEPECVKLLSRDNTVISMNRAGLAMIDANSPEQVKGNSILPLVAPEYADDFKSLTESVFQGISGTLIFEMVGMKGRRRWLDTHAVPLYDSNNEIVALLGITRDITERKRAEDELRELNRSLEQRVTEETELRMQKEHLLLQQSRLAAMGEMVGNIAHQWRQPLNVVGLIIQNIKDAYEYGELDEKYLDENVEKSMEIIQHMSKTIDDFRNFFRPEREKHEFRVKDAVDKAVSLIDATLKNNYIRLDIEIKEDAVAYGYPNEYSQALLNILNNAKDALLESGADNPFITIRVFKEGEKTALTISDNAGGIPEDIMDRVFEPYFTTKEQGKGTGIGLYMSKVIIENNMGGRLTIRNTGDGAEFRIEV
jgi:PAS domain S-box-containing protein